MTAIESIPPVPPNMPWSGVVVTVKNTFLSLEDNVDVENSPFHRQLSEPAEVHSPMAQRRRSQVTLQSAVVINETPGDGIEMQVTHSPIAPPLALVSDLEFMEVENIRMVEPRVVPDKEFSGGGAHGWTNVTTVMMRNLPNKYMQDLLLKETQEHGYHLKRDIDFFYLPMDRNNGANLGYCFINFVSSNTALSFVKAFQGKRMRRFNSSKTIALMPASIQGYEANKIHYASRRVAQADRQYRPLFLRDDPTYSHVNELDQGNLGALAYMPFDAFDADAGSSWRSSHAPTRQRWQRGSATQGRRRARDGARGPPMLTAERAFRAQHGWAN